MSAGGRAFSFHIRRCIGPTGSIERNLIAPALRQISNIRPRASCAGEKERAEHDARPLHRYPRRCQRELGSERHG
jgi:hypothetical protein